MKIYMFLLFIYLVLYKNLDEVYIFYWKEIRFFEERIME
jgi:hypothetical protein